ncbi:hypothetical protein BXY53_2350 [Dichotomicrobium thermohalophilum]|uniref:Uncharacterized protein n=1 Tax=Dichotomicrobium thermohalophilum TaxID=933063 RepID=A0A397PFI7_9HYPH|nr:hypothetical protein BXY53_2350 [Dichotomicrobium thermohalophilum]
MLTDLADLIDTSTVRALVAPRPALQGRTSDRICERQKD